MAEADNGKQPEQPPSGVPLNINITPQGMLLSCSFPVQLGIGDEAMDALTEQWIMQRPALLQKLAQKAIAAKQQELLIIKHVNSRRND